MQLERKRQWLLHHHIVTLFGLWVQVVLLHLRLSHDHLLHIRLVQLAVLTSGSKSLELREVTSCRHTLINIDYS